MNRQFRTLPDTGELPRALYSAAQVREFDRLATTRFGISGTELMERAGQAAWSLLRERWPDARRVLVLTGTGNNGGDGFVVARLAQAEGLSVRVLQLGDRSRLSGDALSNAGRWSASGGSWDDFTGELPASDVIVDAMLGTGLERNVEGPWRKAIEAVNASRLPCLALDIASGLHADSGRVMGAAIRAAVTITFIGLKLGLYTADGPDCSGVVHFDGLGLPAQVYASTVLSARRIDWRKQSTQFTPRARNSHKGHFGHVLVIGGNHGMGGAARLASEAALRVGAGRVSLATRSQHVAAVLAARPEIMVHAVEAGTQIDDLLRQASVIAIGPGLGSDDWARALWERARAAERPLVVDADALRLLAFEPTRRDDWILTPHPGEAAALLGVCTAEIGSQRLDAARQLQRRFGGSVVLKGVGSIIASAGNTPPAICSDGNPGMASAGMGDVLTGVIAGLLAQVGDVRDAAESGVCLHAAAGDAAACSGERGLLAGDLLAWLRSLVNPEIPHA
ncbi:MAG: NAD(P)H-hydrate dehydratase [Gammaproteobacteria bacterium]|nr:NAD(P)H-hydrate dehydratase [Gammaproteobacteria bacterium]